MLRVIAAGIGVFALIGHTKGAEWVAVVLIVIGSGFYDRKTVTGLLKARFSGGGGSGVTAEQETGGA